MFINSCIGNNIVDIFERNIFLHSWEAEAAALNVNQDDKVYLRVLLSGLKNKERSKYVIRSKFWMYK